MRNIPASVISKNRVSYWWGNFLPHENFVKRVSELVGELYPSVKITEKSKDLLCMWKSQRRVKNWFEVFTPSVKIITKRVRNWWGNLPYLWKSQKSKKLVSGIYPIWENNRMTIRDWNDMNIEDWLNYWYWNFTPVKAISSTIVTPMKRKVNGFEHHRRE